MRGTLEAVVADAEEEGEVLVTSPAVGRYGFAPRVGEVLVPGSRVGRLTRLGRTVELLLPSGVTGRVAERVLETRADPVGYGQVLLRLVPVESADLGQGVVSAAEAVTHGLPAGSFAVTSPTHGMFYRRSSPDVPPYVEVGDVVDEGTTVGLVEVMKCFSAIAYGGQGLPPRAEIAEARAEDGAEVQADEVLFVVRDAAKE